jgi:hypothetical protein
MKRIFNLILACILISSCNTTKYYYQLVDIASDDIKDNHSSNQDLDVYFDFWSNGGSTTYKIHNKTEKTLYVKYDECQLIINGEAQDLYDHYEYSNSESSSIKKGKSVSKSASGAISGIGVVSGLLEAYGKSISATSSISKENTNSSSVTYFDKEVYVLAPNSSRDIYGPDLQSYVFSDCDLVKYPTKKESALNNGFSYTKEDSPLKFRVFLTYGFNEQFSDKKTYTITGYVNRISNWHTNSFFTDQKYKDCDKGIYKSRSITEWYSPSRYYVTYIYEVN